MHWGYDPPEKELIKIQKSANSTNLVILENDNLALKARAYLPTFKF